MKKLLSMISVILAMGFVFMSPATAMDFERDSESLFLDESPDVDTAIPIAFHNFDLMELTLSFDDLEKQEQNSYFKPVKYKAVVFSNVQGGGVTSTHGGKARSYTYI